MIVTKKIVSVFLFFLLCGCLRAHAQSTGDTLDMRPGQLKSFGKNAAAIGDYSSASMYYENFMRLRPNNYKVAYKLADSYRLSKSYRYAQEAYIRAYTLQPKKNAAALFYYAEMLRVNGEYERADEYFAKFKKEYKGKDKGQYLKMVKNNKNATEFASKTIANPVKISIERLDSTINTSHVESSPVFINDSTIVYGSLRTDKTFFYFNPEDSSSNEPNRKMYTASRNGDKWEYSGEMNGPFNKEDMHVSNGVYSGDGQHFYFTRCKRNNKNKVICAIYVSHFENGQWQEPVSLGDDVNDPAYTSTQPAVGIESAKNHEVIYFVSDREEGGKGGMDIWYTTYDAKEKMYKAPQNAGAKINTVNDEVTPYFDLATHTMYFSSNGWQTLGGLDIFKTTGELKKWSTPENLGYPINSNYDDLYYVLSKENKETGLFVSNRESVSATGNKIPCCDDLFSFQWLDAVKLNLTGTIYEAPDSSVKGSLTGKLPVRNAKLLLEYKAPEDTTYVTANTVATDENGKFNIPLMPGKEYRLTAKREGYLSEVHDFNTNDKKKSENISIEMSMKISPFDAIPLQNIYYDYAKATLTEAAKESIDTTLLLILQRNPDIVVELSSHTDWVGTDEANNILSQHRAESVVNYLISKGIDAKAMRPKGYGETRPIAPNQNEDGSDNPQGRQLNRRTEFKVIGKLRDNGTIREVNDF